MAATWHDGAGMVVLALVGRHHHRPILRRPLHALLHAARGVGAPVVAPGEGAVLDGLLPVLAPPVTVFKVIHFALRLEREPWLPLTLLPFLLPFLRASFLGLALLLLLAVGLGRIGSVSGSLGGGGGDRGRVRGRRKVEHLGGLRRGDRGGHLHRRRREWDVEEGPVKVLEAKQLEKALGALVCPSDVEGRVEDPTDLVGGERGDSGRRRDVHLFFSLNLYPRETGKTFFPWSPTG
uniref:Uncharacterized protein LOC109506050 n=1 Tax=Elaeis guineensis var. tenera TaxID=51953 RepID=A0A6J0PKN0_ELAGV|nr:uncharacterized protein LOC109506050 [Elaeis guineensis]